MAGKKKEGPTIIGKAKDGRPIIDRFESDWDGVPNFEMKPAAKKPTKKPVAKKPTKKK